jgi:hypothetical protein
MLLDIGAGILFSLFFSRVFGIALYPFFLAGGVFFSLLPDLDFLLNWKKGFTAKGHEHRNLLHYPLLFISLGSIILLFFDYRWAILFAVTTFFHFVHDSIGIGWGVRWPYPFSKNYYAFFYHHDLSKDSTHPKIFYSWSSVEVERLAGEYGDEHWFRNIYLKFSPFAIVEYLVFIFALIMLFLYR